MIRLFVLNLNAPFFRFPTILSNCFYLSNLPILIIQVRNLEGLISIRGELITEAANYNPLDVPCKSLQPQTLDLPAKLTGDLLILIRWTFYVFHFAFLYFMLSVGP